MSKYLKVFFEPVLISLFLLPVFVSLFLALYFWNDINANTNLSSKDKWKWRKFYFKVSLFANSFYYEYKYGKGERRYFLENFFRHSRDKMFRHIEVPKGNGEQVDRKKEVGS
jgi:hypothetical protein